MPYVPPHYAPRDDYETVILNSGGGNTSQSWVTEVYAYWSRVKQSGLLPGEAWRRSRMSQDHAIKALGNSAQPPTPTNVAGLIPPEIAGKVFAAALARSVETDTESKVVTTGRLIHVDRDATEMCFVQPRYWPRPDWQERLEAIDPNGGTWQAALARYWRMRLREKEEDAWSDLAMSAAQAKAALIEDENDPDSGLIPWLPHDKETVARRVLARSVASKIGNDIYAGLALGPPEELHLDARALERKAVAASLQRPTRARPQERDSQTRKRKRSRKAIKPR